MVSSYQTHYPYSLLGSHLPRSSKYQCGHNIRPYQKSFFSTSIRHSFAPLRRRDRLFYNISYHLLTCTCHEYWHLTLHSKWPPSQPKPSKHFILVANVWDVIYVLVIYDTLDYLRFIAWLYASLYRSNHWFSQPAHTALYTYVVS